MTKQEIYDLICKVLTDSEQEEYCTLEDEAADMYGLLVLIQNNWESVITNVELANWQKE